MPNIFIFCFTVWCIQLGANAILAVSLAVCKAGASIKKIPLYQVCKLLMLIITYFPIKYDCSREFECFVCSTLPILLATSN